MQKNYAINYYLWLLKWTLSFIVQSNLPIGFDTLYEAIYTFILRLIMLSLLSLNEIVHNKLKNTNDEKNILQTVWTNKWIKILLYIFKITCFV